jgi:hypothetical protein
MKKPNPAAVRKAPPLSILPLSVDRLDSCNVCGKSATVFRAWRAWDEFDRAPIAGTRALVFLAADHPDCLAKLEAHPRLFKEVAGQPGHFPGICGPCVLRKDLACTSPDLKASGGGGLKVEFSSMTGVLCFGRGRGGCQTILQHAVACAGRVEATP